jgi:hypothetical protein
MKPVVIGVLAFVLAGCSSPAAFTAASSANASQASASQENASPQPTASAVPTPSPSPLPALVGQWELNRTCAAIVAALTKARLTDFIPASIPETLEGVPDNGPLPKTWDPKRPCVNARPPTEHSHTFWADGAFNSFNENGQQVDEGTYQIVDDHTFAIGTETFQYTVAGDTIAFDVVIPKACTTRQCRDDLQWAFTVAYPGQIWRRVMSGPHVPPGTGSG